MKLADVFRRNGYVRAPDMEKRKQFGLKYRKGWEVRLVLASEEDLEETRRLLAKAGLTAGQPFTKHSRWVQPVYGKTAVEFFVGDRQREK